MKSFTAFIGALCAAFMFNVVSASADGTSSNLANFAAKSEKAAVEKGGPDTQTTKTVCASCASIVYDGVTTEVVGVYHCVVQTKTNGAKSSFVQAAAYVDVYDNQSGSHSETPVNPKTVKIKKKSFRVAGGQSCKAANDPNNYTMSGKNDMQWANGNYDRSTSSAQHYVAITSGFRHNLSGELSESYDRFQSKSKDKGIVLPPKG